MAKAMGMRKPDNVAGSSAPAIMVGLFVATGGLLFGYDTGYDFPLSFVLSAPCCHLNLPKCLGFASRSNRREKKKKKNQKKKPHMQPMSFGYDDVVRELSG